MNTFTDFTLSEEYKRIRRPNDRLAGLESFIERDIVRTLIGKMYSNLRITCKIGNKGTLTQNRMRL